MKITWGFKTALKMTILCLVMQLAVVAEASNPGEEKVAVKQQVLEEINLKEIKGMFAGSVQDDKAKTGITALIFPKGAMGGVDISGGGPASRETPVLSPTTADTPINAIVLSGGSAYGLEAGSGVMRALEDKGIGFDTGFALVPIVVQSSIYDLSYGSSKIRPDVAMGYKAVEEALNHNELKSGNYGAGTGATVGKICGMGRSMKSGLGVYGVKLGKLQMAAIVAVNALGDIYDANTNKKIAGLTTADRKGFADSKIELYKTQAPKNFFNKENTTIGCVITNGVFSKAQLTKIASMTRVAYSKSINPVATMADGDSIYAVSVEPNVKADINVAGTLAAEVMAEAIRRAIVASQLEDKEYLSHCQGLTK